MPTTRVSDNVKQAVNGSVDDANVLVISSPYALELVENAVIFVEVTKFASQMVMDWNGLDRS